MSEALDLSASSPLAQNNAPKRKRKVQGKKSTGSNSTVPLPPCKVCLGSSTGYHFGAVTCEACKAFFRRVLVHKHQYKCVRGGNCNIAEKKLGNCSACRLKKCYEVGMSKGGIRKGRYSIAVRTQAIIEANASKGKDAAIVVPSGNLEVGDNSFSSSIADLSPCSGERILTFSGLNEDSVTITVQSNIVPGSGFRSNIELELLIDAITGYQEAVYPELKTLHQISMTDVHHRTFADYEAKQTAFQNLFGNPGTVSAEEFKQVFAETGIDLDDRVSHFNEKGRLMEESIARYVNFGKVVPGFKNINPKDVSRLLKASHLEFWMFGHFICFNDDLGLAVSFNNSHYGTKEQMQKFFSSDWTDTAFKMAESIKKLNLSLEEIALIRVIILTYTDRCQLTDREYIQALQEKFVECLEYQLNKTKTNPSKCLYQIFDRLLSIREFTELNQKENMIFLQKWQFLIEEFPLWKEMLSYNEF